MSRTCTVAIGHTSTDEPIECGEPATYLAFHDVPMCDEHLHARFEDEPVSFFDANVVKLPPASQPTKGSQ